MGYIFGFLIAVTSLYLGVNHLGQDVRSYFDWVAFFVVLGGTIAVSLILLPLKNISLILKGLSILTVRLNTPIKSYLNFCISFIDGDDPESFIPNRLKKRIEFQTLIDGGELISLNFDKDTIDSIISERITTYYESLIHLGNTIRSLAKYPPAFGLAGTVLGLVHLMQGVSEGISGEETGIRMAIALVATFYGLMVANLILAPAGEKIVQQAKKDLEISEIGLRCILLKIEKRNKLEAVEILNSYCSKKDRYKLNLTSSEAA